VYCVSRCEFERTSEVLKDMFATPEAGGHEIVEGSSEEHPIILAGYLKVDFDVLLKVMFPM